MSSSISAPETYVKDTFRFCWDTLGNFLRVSEVFPAALDQAQDAYKNETVFFTIRSAKATHFTTAIVQNAFEDESLAGLSSNKIRIKEMKVLSIQNLDWEFRLFQKSTFRTVDLDTDSPSGSNYFDALSGKQDAGVNQYYYDSGSIDKLYENLDGTFVLDISLINRSAVAKIAAAPGYIVVICDYEPAS